MKRLALAVLPALTLLASGCAIVQPHGYGTSRSAIHDESCPPGHRWEDGRCHRKGKGHDPAKHRGKKGKHERDD